MSFSEQDMAAVVEQLKTAIAAGKFTCHRCHYPLGGAAITQIDLFNGRIVYKCTNPECDNHNKSGYRTLRALNIDVPAMKAPASLADVAAPAPPRPEEVDWSDGSDETSAILDSNMPENLSDDVDDEPIQEQAPTVKPVSAPSQKTDIADDPNSEE